MELYKNANKNEIINILQNLTANDDIINIFKINYSHLKNLHCIIDANTTNSIEELHKFTQNIKNNNDDFIVIPILMWTEVISHVSAYLYIKHKNINNIISLSGENFFTNAKIEIELSTEDNKLIDPNDSLHLNNNDKINLYKSFFDNTNIFSPSAKNIQSDSNRQINLRSQSDFRSCLVLAISSLVSAIKSQNHFCKIVEQQINNPQAINNDEILIQLPLKVLKNLQNIAFIGAASMQPKKAQLNITQCKDIGLQWITIFKR